MSKPQAKVKAQAKKSFWAVVEDCLVDFHHLTRAEAHSRSAALRRQIDDPPEGIDSDVFYHAEPFDVACDIAENPLDLGLNRSKYDVILKNNKW